MSIYQMTAVMADRLKPFLLRIFPKPFLLKIKKQILKFHTWRLKKEKIEPFERRRYRDGINLFGNIRGDFGLGQSCRLVAWELEYSGVPFGVCEYHSSKTLHMDDHSCDRMLQKQPQYNINLFHINAAQFVSAYYRIGGHVWDGRYNIAFWLWELEEFPKEWTGCIKILHEIWTPSEFVSRAIRKKTDKPVITIPYQVKAPIDAAYDRAYFHLPEDSFLFLMMYDSLSVMERKNPAAVLKAFQKAFAKENREVGLVIKLNGNQPKEMDAIKKFLDGYQNIYFMTDVLSKTEVNSLTACVDVYVSLHRAEGFGLVMAEAMLNGIPCIATNWSANTEFMDAQSACMVDYRLVPIPKDIGPFRKGQFWAQPNVGQAAEYMKKLYLDKTYYQKKAEHARRHAKEQFDQERIAGLIRNRVRQIYQSCHTKGGMAGRTP